MSWTEPAETISNAEPISVSGLLQRAKLALERALPLCWVSGEISGFKRAASGHCYFDLKDDAAQIACVLYRNRAALAGFELKDGAQVELRVRPSVYEPRGSLQFTVEQARLAGVGRLYEAFLRLKAKLDAEGLFADELKRELPAFPRCIGLITSTRAAALADMLRVLRDRWPRAQIVVYPASVQGASAPRELLAALNAANARAECDVLIIGRGGGSIEDLWAFNDEALVRAVAASSVPIVSAVGHETDFTLCDFAADVRAPTPTAAATMVTPEQHKLRTAVGERAQRLIDALDNRCNRLAERLDHLAAQLRSSLGQLAPWREALLRAEARLQRCLTRQLPMQHARLEALARTLVARQLPPPAIARRLSGCEHALAPAMRSRLLSAQHRLDRAATALAHLNPENVLDRGYVLVYDGNGALVTDHSPVSIGEQLTLHSRRRRVRVTADEITDVKVNPSNG